MRSATARCSLAPRCYGALERARISPAGQRGIHILSRLSQQGLLCFASHKGNQPSFALLDAWIPMSRAMERDEALAELTARYFRGHGPATVRDFAWWAGLTLGDARAGIAAAAPQLEREMSNGTEYFVSRDAPVAAVAKRAVHSLPGFDEYLLGYTDRSVVLDRSHASSVVPGNNGMFMPTIVSGGRVVGTWKAPAKNGRPAVKLAPFDALSARDASAAAAAAKRYGRFVLRE